MPGFVNRNHCVEILESGEAMGSLLVILAELALGAETVWGSDEFEPVDPLVLYELLEEHFNVKLDEQDRSRLSAIRECILTDAFYQDPEVCRLTAMLLSNAAVGDISDTLLENPTLDELMWADYELQLFRDDPEASVAVTAAVDRIWRQAEAVEASDPEEDGEEPGSGVLEKSIELVRQLNYCGITVETLLSLGPK